MQGIIGTRRSIRCAVRQQLKAVAAAFALVVAMVQQVNAVSPGAKDANLYGVGASLSGAQIFPPTNPWNEDISARPVSAQSDVYINSIGADTPVHPDFGTKWNKQPWGIPYIVVRGNQKRTNVKFEYESESDPGPYPIPSDPPIEGGPNSTQDRHVILVDRDNLILYELFHVFPPRATGSMWTAGSGAIFDLRKNTLRPSGFTSADAAGLPVFPGLVRWDEVYEKHEISHALRFTASRTRRAYISPARHFASSTTDPSVPPMGLRVRLKSSFDIAEFPPSAQIILKALKKYGMFLADNGKDWFISGAPDPRWNDAEIHALARLKGRDFEVIEQGRASDGH